MIKLNMFLQVISLVAVTQFAASAGFAATQSTTLNTRANIVVACRVSATAMNFGIRSTVLGTETALSTLTVICNNLTPYNVSLRSGSALLIRAVNLRNPAGNTIRVGLSLGSTGGVSGGSHALTGQLVAKAYPQVGLYQRTQTFFVNY